LAAIGSTRKRRNAARKIVPPYSILVVFNATRLRKQLFRLHRELSSHERSCQI
jgi:hypothetical protein